MRALIIRTAQEDSTIRAVFLEGSRANPNVKRDAFQDYDVVYVATDPTPYIQNLEWIKRFGELLILQMPDCMGTQDTAARDTFTYLMQFTDGNRIDLTICSLEHFAKRGSSSLSVVLLDKDAFYENHPVPDETDYFPVPPTESDFSSCCNEFFWVSPYVAKGLWRGQVEYAFSMLETILRPELLRMMTWHFGIETAFKANPGKCGSNFHAGINPEFLDLLSATHATASIEEIWTANEKMQFLFGKIALLVAEHFGYSYPSKEASRVKEFLLHIKQLAPDATEIFSDQ